MSSLLASRVSFFCWLLVCSVLAADVPDTKEGPLLAKAETNTLRRSPKNSPLSPSNLVNSGKGKMAVPLKPRLGTNVELPDLKPDEAVITVNGDKLLWGAMLRHAELLISRAKLPPDVTAAEVEGEKKRMLMKTILKTAEHFITKGVLAQEARRQGLALSGADFLAKREELVERAKTQPENAGLFLKELDTPGSFLSIDITNTLLVAKLNEKVIRPSIRISDDDLKLFMGERVATNKVIDAYNAGLRPKLAAILSRIKQGESFSDVAYLESECGSSANGGEWGTFKREDLRPEIADVAFGMKEGELSDIVETPYSYHIIKLLKKNELFAVAGTASASTSVSVGIAHIMLEKKERLPELTPTSAKKELLEIRQKEALDQLKVRLIKEAKIETPLPLY